MPPHSKITYTRKRSRQENVLPVKDADVLKELEARIDSPEVSPSKRRSGILMNLTPRKNRITLSSSHSLSNEASSPPKMSTPSSSSLMNTKQNEKSSLTTTTSPNPNLTFTVDPMSPRQLLSPRKLKTYLQSRSYLAPILDPQNAQTNSSFHDNPRRLNFKTLDSEQDDASELMGVHTLRLHGENNKFIDEMEYLLDGLDDDSNSKLQLFSAVDIVKRLSEHGFVHRLAATNILHRVEECLCSNKDSGLQYCWWLFLIYVSRYHIHLHNEERIEKALMSHSTLAIKEEDLAYIRSKIKNVIEKVSNSNVSQNQMQLLALDAYVSAKPDTRLPRLIENGILATVKMLSDLKQIEKSIMISLDVIETLSQPHFCPSSKRYELIELGSNLLPLAIQAVNMAYRDPFAPDSARECVNRILRIWVNLCSLQDVDMDDNFQNSMSRIASIVYYNAINQVNDNIVYAIGMLGKLAAEKPLELCFKGRLDCLEKCKCGNSDSKSQDKGAQKSYFASRLSDLEKKKEDAIIESVFPYARALVDTP